MKAGLQRVLALALGVSALAIPASAAATFTDVPSTYWGYSYITEAASKGLVSGIGNNKYGPEDTLSNAQFITMVCNMFYSDQVDSQGSSSQWWRRYMNVAYANGLLNGTTVAGQFSANGDWTTSAVDAEISRYDMAQIIYNLSNAQRWEMPDSMSLAFTQLLIKDFSTVPTNYQMAVAVCYAKGFMSGDNNGNFNGSASSNRAQAAVVLCSLDKADAEMNAPIYSNSNRLANGLAATEENVSDLLDELWAEFPDYDQWDVDRTYTSQRLGSSSGTRGFVYMLSDRVFGGMPSNEIDDPADLRLGDMIVLNSGSQYGLVCEVDNTTFSYVTCDSDGWIDWSNDMDLDDLDDRHDTVYTRYLDLPKADDVLSNGKEATRANVEDLLDDLQDDRDYRDGKSWDLDDEYDSDVFGSYSGTRGFAYQISDEIFGDLDYETVDREDDLRVGDVVYDEDGYGLYGVVVSVNSSRERYTYVSVNEDDEIDWGLTGYFEDLNLSRTYTRYPEDAEYDDEDDTLTNGDSITTSHVSDLLDEVLDDVRYDYDDYWDLDERYDSDVFGSKNYEDEAFAYYVSDEIYGNRDYDSVDDPEDLRVGDVIYDDDDGRYGVVMEADDDEWGCYYATVDLDDGRIRLNVWCDYDDIDEMYTRY